MERFLKAKHWQLFLLTFGIPLISQIVIIILSFSDFYVIGENADTAFLVSYVMFFILYIIVFIATFFGWFWSIAIGLQNKIPENIKMKTIKFKIFFFTPVIYFSCFTIYFLAAYSLDFQIDGVILFLFLPLHLLSMYSMFYNLYYVSKTIKTIELQREVGFSNFAGEFFLIWFYPIGIWIIQPRINKIYNQV